MGARPLSPAAGSKRGHVVPRDVSPLGLITGMKSEAALLYAAAQDGSDPVCPMIAVTGGDPLRAETAAREFATAGAAGLISFGIAGGLDPALEPGDLISTGTISGVGSTTGTFMKPGDKVQIEISSIGVLKNTVAASKK